MKMGSACITFTSIYLTCLNILFLGLLLLHLSLGAIGTIGKVRRLRTVGRREAWACLVVRGNTLKLELDSPVIRHLVC